MKWVLLANPLSGGKFFHGWSVMDLVLMGIMMWMMVLMVELMASLTLVRPWAQ